MKTKIESFEDSESRFIVKKIILPKIKINPTNLDVTLKPSKRLQRTLLEIESKEDSWAYMENDVSETFGRKIKNEPLKFWSIPRNSARVISYLALYSNSKNILEIGTSAGYSTLYLAQSVEYNQGKVKTIENNKVKKALALDNFRKSGLENKIELIQGNAKEILSEWKTPIDFVFLDADKENYGKYLDLLLPHMEKGGLIVADNINDYGHMMTDYLKKVSGSHFPESSCYPNLDSVWIAQLDNGLMVTKVKGENEK
ncbi:class I SAM-dependent methyltransferase [Candidatus Pacearchaeota archaeon]|nr:class I SAM-dependent methyltransferase [Candidatus Pacearchaeota archaeon]